MVALLGDEEGEEKAGYESPYVGKIGYSACRVQDAEEELVEEPETYENVSRQPY